MKARQNPISKFESFMQRIVETPFARLFPSKLEPVELARRLERAMEDNLLHSVDRRLAPNLYDIYLSIKDHQRLSPSQAILIKELQDHLVTVARQRHYTLRSVPILRLHTDSKLSPGEVSIVAELADRQHMGVDTAAAGGVIETQALSAEQLAQMRQQLSGNLPPGSAGSTHLTSSPGNIPPITNPSSSLTNTPMPSAKLTIRLPQAGKQLYNIEKPVINIGRQLSNDIIVEDKRVSRYHAQIKYQPDGQFVIFDLGSTNGITVNGTPHLRQHTLLSGDHFMIGNYDFYFERK